MSKAIKEFNGLNGTVGIEEVQKLAELAKQEGQLHLYNRLIAGLEEAQKHNAHKFNPGRLALEEVSAYDLPGMDPIPSYISPEEFTGLNKAVSPDEIYQYITDLILKRIEKADNLPWHTMWENKNDVDLKNFKIYKNFDTKKEYRGINMFMLNLDAFGDFVFRENPYFLTFKQIQKHGGSLRKGSKGVKIVYFVQLYQFTHYEEGKKTMEFATYNEKKYKDWLIKNKAKIESLTGKKIEAFTNRYIPILKYYNVYSGEDVEGIDFGDYPKSPTERPESEKIEVADGIIANYPDPPKIIYYGNQPAYYPLKDELKMTPKVQFAKPEWFYSVLFHELTHSTGHSKRKDRGNDTRVRDNSAEDKKAYDFEELVAEMGAVFLCAESGILFITRDQSAKYLDHYIQKLKKRMKEDNRFFFRAASAAQAAADHILDRDKDGIPAYLRVTETSKSKKNTPKAEQETPKAVKKKPTKEEIEAAENWFFQKYNTDGKELVKMLNGGSSLYMVSEAFSIPVEILESKEFIGDLLAQNANEKLGLTVKGGYGIGKLPLDNLQEKKVSVKKKSPIKALERITAKDTLRPNMTGVYFDKEGYVATNAHVMAIIPDKVIKKNEVGKILNVSPKWSNTNSQYIDGKYPNWKVVIPTWENENETGWLKLPELLTKVNSIANALLKVKKFAPQVGLNKSIYVNPFLLLDLLLIFAEIGYKEVKFSGSKPNRAIRIKGKNGEAHGLIMPVMSYNEQIVANLEILPNHVGLNAPIDKEQQSLFTAIKKKPGLKSPTTEPVETFVPVENQPTEPKPTEGGQGYSGESPRPIVSGNALKASDVANMDFETLPLDEGWENLFQTMPRNMRIATWAKPKNGKTAACCAFASYLTKFGPILYNFADQGINLSTKNLIQLCGLDQKPNAFISTTDQLDVLANEIESTGAHHVVIDMINQYINNGVTPHIFKQKILQRFPNVGFNLVMEVTKSGDFKGDQAWTHLVDQLVTIENYIMDTKGRYGTGEKISWEEGAQKYDPARYEEIKSNLTEAAPEPDPLPAISEDKEVYNFQVY